VGQKITFGLIRRVSRLLRLPQGNFDILSPRHETLDLLSNQDEIGFGKTHILILKELKRLPEAIQEILIPSVLADQFGIGLRKFLGTDLHHMLRQLPVIIALVIGCLDLRQKSFKSLIELMVTPKIPPELT
jgi:hypothetical protein